MAQLLSADLPPEPDFPSEFPYEVVDTLPSYTSDDDDDPVDLDYNGHPTRRLPKYSSYRCDGIPVIKKLSVSPKSTLDGTDNRSTPAGVSQLPNPSLVPFHSSDADLFDLVHAAAALQLERLKVAPEKSSSFRHLPEQYQLPLSLNRDPFSLPCFGQSTMRRNAREVEFVKQRHDALLLAQQRQLQIQAQISKAGPLRNRSGSVRGCAGTGVFLPRGYGDVAPESCKISGGPTLPRVVVPAKVVRALNKANVQLQGRDELLLERRIALWMRLHHHHQHLQDVVPNDAVWGYDVEYIG